MKLDTAKQPYAPDALRQAIEHVDRIRQQAESDLATLLAADSVQMSNSVQASSSVQKYMGSQVGVIGVGLMGVAIAETHLKAGYRVTVCDTDSDVLHVAPQRIRSELELQLRLAADTKDSRSNTSLKPHIKIRSSQGRPTSSGQNTQTERAGRIVQQQLCTVNTPSELADCDLVIETVPELAEIKRTVYTELVPRMKPTAILTSNTSTIPIGQLADVLPKCDLGNACDANESIHVAPSKNMNQGIAQRFCGYHFFHPVRDRSLLEIMRGPLSSDEAIAHAIRYARSIDKLPIVVEDGAGFLINRMLNPYLTEAMQLLLEGASIEQIERCATEFGMAIGPLRMLDEIGLDVTLYGGHVLYQAYPDRVTPSPLLVRLIKKKRLGRKVGRGFFCYETEQSWAGPGRVDDEVLQMIERWKESDGPIDDETVTLRLMLSMMLESIRVLEEGKVAGPHIVDLGVVLGLGFPASRGGLLYWADRLGTDRVMQLIEPFESLGPCMHAPELLKRLAAENRGFYR